MGWRETFVGGFILVIILLSLATTFTGYLVATHQTCAFATASSSSSSELFASNSTSLGNGSLSPVPLPAVADDLVLSPLATLSLPQGDATSLAFLTNATYWGEVDASELQTYAQLIPQTVLGFINSSQEWRDWALQYIPDPPAWLATGVVAAAQAQVLEIGPSAGGNSSTVKQSVREFAASAAGVSLASLDFVSFNGLTGLKTLFETNDLLLAACQTLPGQLAQLYESSFDSSVPQDQRADYLGRALAITSVMLLVGGKDRFADQFQGALDAVGLADSWPGVKPYLGDIAAKVSASASSATFGILQTLAGRFPSDSVWATGLTANQIDTMVDVLQDNGVPNAEIQSDIQKVAQAASTSPNEDGAAGVAEDLQYQQDGGWLKMVVNTQNTLTVYTDATGRTQCITVSWLQTNVPGFDPAQAQFIQISYGDQDAAVYNYYSGPKGGGDVVDGGRQWKVSTPSDVAPAGTIVKVRLQILTAADFVGRMPLLEFNGFDLDAPYMAEASRFTSYSLSGSDLTIGVTQSEAGGLPIGDFQIHGTQAILIWTGKVVALDFQVIDVFGEETELRLVFSGYSNPQFRIATGETDFAQVLLVSNDGVKLKLLYDTGPDDYSTTTIYLKPPSTLWSLGAEAPGDPQYLASGGSTVYQIDEVTPTRSLEAEIIRSDSTYDKGVLGAEIAYTVGTEKLGLQKLGLQNLILHETSEGGPDLNTADKTTFIQARMLDLHDVDPSQIPAQIQGQLPDMITDLYKDFSYNKNTATMGYAIISYIDNQYSITTIIVQVPYQ